MSSDPLNAAWEQAQNKSFEDLKREANEQKAKRENLQPLKVGKVNYGSVFRVGDRTRPELALSLGSDQTRGESIGTGQVNLDELIPASAFKDLDHALAQAAVGVQAETAEGVREEVVYDRDESEVLGWQPSVPRLVITPPVVERASDEAESAAYAGDPGDENDAA